MASVASFLEGQGRLTEGMALRRVSCTHLERQLGENHTLVAHGLGKVGTSLYYLNRYDDAEFLLRRSLRIFQVSPFIITGWVVTRAYAPAQ